ncbi:MAG: acetylornithine transaminase [Armatimonadota bacterium]
MAVIAQNGIDTQTIMKMDAEFIMHTFNRQPVVLVRGEGMRVWDADGREYLDFLAGIAVNGLGHCHPDLVKAISEQAGTLMHVCNLYYVPQAPELAKKLSELSGLDKSFFCNSGAEANEAAIKLARKWSYETHGPGKFEIITAKASFHGRTMAAVTATGQPKYHEGFEPMVPGFKYVPYNDLAALESTITEQTCAIMLEPIQGESGVWPASKEYLAGVREICDKKGLLLILDEVQTGLGRTGKWFGFQHFGIKPDIMTLAKTLGGGFPIGACLATDNVAKAFKPGNHASTFGGNPLACAAALATLGIIEDENLVSNAAEMGDYFKDSLNDLKIQRDDIKEVRGVGLMVGLELNRNDAPAIAAECLRLGLIINPIGENIIRFLPPLIVKEEHIDSAINIVSEALSNTAQKS